MTKEEAIQVLKRTIAYESDFAEAKRMAIEALSEPSECESCKWYEPNHLICYPKSSAEPNKVDFRTDKSANIGTEVNDLISRADAMGAVQDHFNADGFKGYDDGQKMMDRIKTLPSAEAVPQLKQTDTLIIADALRYLAKDTERHLSDRTRADALRQQFLKYGASMCKGGDSK